MKYIGNEIIQKFNRFNQRSQDIIDKNEPINKNYSNPYGKTTQNKKNFFKENKITKIIKMKYYYN